MKQLSSWRAVILLIAPVMLLLGVLFLPVGVARSQSASSMGTMVIGFKGKFLQHFQSISLNVVAVRLNPSTDSSVSDLDPNWVTIGIPQGVGLNGTGAANPSVSLATLFNLSSGQSPGNAGTGPSELQIDLNRIQSLPQLFNSALVPASTYHQIEVELHSGNAGVAIPDCLSNSIEGCIASRMTIQNTSAVLRTSGTVSIPAGGLTTLIIKINPMKNGGTPQPPSYSGGTYNFQPGISISTTTLGRIVGFAHGASQVLAELSGTDQVMETTTLGNGYYQLALPASGSGTLYDLVATGPGRSVGFARQVLAERGVSKTVNLSLSPDGHVSLSGKVTDGCSGAPIQGATLEILASASGHPGRCATLPTPSDCVVVASANTDDTGTYPMPASNYVSQAFQNVPQGLYAILVKAAGYDTVASKLTVGGAGAGCSAGSGGRCSFALGRSKISGLVTINPPVAVGSKGLNVLVAAEDHGTHHIENVALASVPPGSSTAPFSMFVPDVNRVSSLDMYAAVNDYFNGSPERDSGHTIAVVNGIPSGGRCGTNPVSPQLKMQCAGHASVTGSTSASTYDDGTSIVLSKDGVQLMSSNVGPAGSSIAAQYSFCAPADPTTYTLQRFEASPPGTMPSPVGSPTSVVMATPVPVPQPCSSICSTGSSSCLVCVNQSGVVVP